MSSSHLLKKISSNWAQFIYRLPFSTFHR